jgi:MFS family permease
MTGAPRLRYYLFRVTTSWGFYIPVSIIYLLDSDFGLGFVALTQAIFSFGLLAAEIPTGYLGDRIGRRGTLALGSGIRTVGLLGYAIADTAAMFLACQVLFAIGWAFKSGTVDAWGYELLAAYGEEDEYARVEGRGRAAVLAVSAGGAVLGGILYTIEPGLPFLVNAGLAAAGLPVLALTSPVSSSEEAGEEPFGLREAGRVIGSLLGRADLRWVVVFVTVIFAIFDLSRTFEQPALRTAGVSDASLGVVFGVLKLITAGVASTAGQVKERLGPRGGLTLLVPILGMLYAALLVTPLVVLPFVFLYRMVRTVANPLRNQYLNDRLEDNGRATALSGVSMILAVVSGSLRLVAGPIGEITGPVTVLGIFGVGLAAGGGLIWYLKDPFDRGELGVSSGRPAPSD